MFSKKTTMEMTTHEPSKIDMSTYPFLILSTRRVYLDTSTYKKRAIVLLLYVESSFPNLETPCLYKKAVF